MWRRGGPARTTTKAAAAAAAAACLSLVLLSSAPRGVDCSRARRRHPSPEQSNRKPAFLATKQGLTQEDTPIPGVSIWTSRAAASSPGGASAAVRKAQQPDGASRVVAGAMPRDGACCGGGSGDLLGDCQDGRGDIGDADVEPPSRAERADGEEIGEEEYGGVLTSEEEDDAQGNADAAPGRMLEEGGGSDSQDDETDSGHTDDDENDEGSDTYDDGSGESQSEDDDDDGAVRSASRGWGRGGVRGRYGKEAPSAVEEGEEGGVEGALSLAKMYEKDEEACFSRVKELWREKVLPPLSHAEIEEISEGVRPDQKHLMNAAPTEWNSGLSRAVAEGKRVSGRRGAAGGDEAFAGAVGGDGAAWGDEDSSLGLLYRLLLAEMQGDGPTGGLNNRWIDRDALLQLRGAATLAHRPEFLRYTTNLPRVTRGVRLVAPEATHSMQEALARSLGHSTRSNLVLLDSKALESVRGRALAEGVPKGQLSSRQLTAALLEMGQEDSSPLVVFLMDKGSAVLKNRGVCHRLTEELKSDSSRVLFLLSTASDQSVPGNVPVGPGGGGSDGMQQDDLEHQQQGGGGLFGSHLQWPPSPNQMPPGQSKRSMQDGSAKKNFIFLQPTQSEGGNGSGGGYFGGRSPRGGRGGRSRGRGQPPGQGSGRGMPPGQSIPPQMLEQLLREAMKSMKSGGSNGQANDQASDPNGSSGQDDGEEGGGGGNGGAGGSGSGEIPPGLLEALGEALNDDEFKSTLEQIGKQLGKEMNQGFSIMFSTSTSPQQPEEGGEGGGDGESHPWGAAGPGEGSSGKGGHWQGPSSLSWLTNLRKGIMSGDEARDGENGLEYNDVDESGGDHNGSGGRGGGGDGGGGGGGGSDGRKGDSRKGTELPPSGTEMRSFMELFEDIAIDPPQDAVLRQHWDTWVEEDVGKHNTQQNRQVLITALRRNMLACPELRRLDPLLARHRLTDAETGQVVLAALKVELTKTTAAGGAIAPAGGDETGGGAARVWVGGQGGEPQPLPSPRQTAKGRLVISRQSMETAFAAVCKAYVPRPGQPMTRTREEVTALAQHDRHEQALVANVILPKDIGVTYDMIGGLGGAKELLRQCITYPLRFPHLYNEGIAKEAVKGVLLFGPPGTGKTMLAKAVATEGGATFLSVDASVIENKWLGESEKNARAVFTLARRLAPCVIFIDEVDSVLSSREKYDDTTHGTLTSVKTTLMQEWDGLRTGGDRVVVIASTNRPFDLDEAVLRRLPRRILVDLPDAETREEILKVSMAQNRVEPSVNYTAITAELEGFTGSDIKEVCREAVVRIAHEKAQELDKGGGAVPGEEVDLTARLRPVTMDDFREARKKLTASVSEKGRELSRVWEWNEEYGEVKKKKSDASSHHLSMYL